VLFVQTSGFIEILLVILRRFNSNFKGGTNNGGRSYFLGREGDKINAILSGCGYNIRKLLKALLF
jgi:hypothetical protein